MSCTIASLLSPMTLFSLPLVLNMYSTSYSSHYLWYTWSDPCTHVSVDQMRWTLISDGQILLGVVMWLVGTSWMTTWKSVLGRNVPKSYMELISPLRRTCFSHVRAKATEDWQGCNNKGQVERTIFGAHKRMDGMNQTDGWMDGWMGAAIYCSTLDIQIWYARWG
jgi:hypothetical protein